MNTKHLINALLFTALSLGIGPAMAEGVSVASKVEKIIETVDEKGNAIIQHVEPEVVIPGDTVIYTTVFDNKGDKQADNIVIVSDIDANVTLIGGSLKGNALTTFSVDGGSTFATPDKLKILDEKRKPRPATPADYTHIRWQVQHLGIGERLSVSFQAQINEE